jgi:two-component system OmpR family sensor kinase
MDYSYLVTHISMDFDNIDINEYYKPFNHEYEDSSAGLGLGLYISNNIIKIHNYKLEYEYIDDYHNFVIKLN